VEQGLAGPSPDPLRRYPGLQRVSLLLIVGGILALLSVFVLQPGLLAGEQPSVGEAIGILMALLLGGLAVVTGLVMNAVRAVIVREALPPGRYRGPSLIILTVLAALIANAASLAVAADLLALDSGDAPSVAGSLLLLTVTHLGLLAAAALFVALPRALAGARFLPEHGLLRSIGLGFVLAIPAWVGAQQGGAIIVRLLGLLGMEPETGVIEAALEQANPVVLVVALVVVAPIVEEIFFRGIVYNAWQREYGERRALYGSAVLFGTIHASVFAFLPIVGLGIVLALVYRATRSLPASIALHATFNAITVAITLLIRYEIIEHFPIPF
jgi:membrane protease YdiL (CAAX protease family)